MTDVYDPSARVDGLGRSLSASGKMAWDGNDWVPAVHDAGPAAPNATPVQRAVGDPKVTVGAGTAFKIGFFGALGAAVVAIPAWVVAAVLSYHPVVP